MEELIEQIIERIKKLQEEPTDVNIGKVAELNLVMIRLQQLTLTDASQQRKLLIDFCTKLELKAKQYSYLIPDEDFIDEYLKNNKLAY